MMLRRWLLVTLLAAAVLCVGFVVLIVSVAVVAAGAVAQVLVEGAAFFAPLVIPYAVAYLAWFATWPQAVLFVIEHWSFLAAWWKWLSGL